MAFLIGRVRVNVIAILFILAEGLAITQVSIDFNSNCLECSFKEFGMVAATTTPVPEIPTEEAATELPPTITPVPTVPTEEPATVPTEEPATEWPPTITPVTTIPTEEPPATELPPRITPVPTVPTEEPPATELPPTITPVPTIPTEEPPATELPPTITPVPTIPTEEPPATELPPTITPVPTIPTEEPPATEETEPSIPTTENPFPPDGVVTDEDECSTFGDENREPPPHCFDRTLRPPTTMKPLPPPEASEKPDVGYTEPPVVSTTGYPGEEITPPPMHCPPNEVYKECDFLCQPSCKRPKRPKKCPYICIPRCLCKKPLVRRESDGKCVRRSMCPKCKKPKKPDGCPPCPKCNKLNKKLDGFSYNKKIFKPPTDNRRPPTDQGPPIYPRIDQGPPTDQRPPIYPPKNQGPPSDQFELPTDYEGPPIDEFYLKRPPTHHGWKKCPPQEVFSMYAGACQATCRQPKPKCASGCICRKPFVRREVDGKCVPRSKCHCKERKHCKQGIMGRQSKKLWNEH